MAKTGKETGSVATTETRPPKESGQGPIENTPQAEKPKDGDKDEGFLAAIKKLFDLRKQRSDLKQQLMGAKDQASINLLRAQISEVNQKIKGEVKQARATDSELDKQLKEIEDKLQTAIELKSTNQSIEETVSSLKKDAEDARQSQENPKAREQLNGLVREEVAEQTLIETKQKAGTVAGARVEPPPENPPQRPITVNVPELARDPAESDDHYAGRLEQQRNQFQELLNQVNQESRPGLHFAGNPEYENMMGGAGSGNERPPSIETSPGEALSWFNRRLQTLEEEFYNQSFDQRWQLVYPVEQFILSLSRQEGNLPQEFDYHGRHYTNYKDIRLDLSSELEARRSRHNHTYVYRRVSGTADLIGAADLLDTKNIQTLFRIPEVSAKFRELERMAQNGVDPTQMLRLQQADWAGRIAGGLFSALGEAPRHGVLLNGAGDFFHERVQNFPKKVTKTIDERYPNLDDRTRNKLKEIIPPAMNLMTKTYWMDLLDEAKKEDHLGGAGFFNFCRENQIVLRDNNSQPIPLTHEGLARADWSKTDLTNARFENINFGIDGQSALKLPDDKLKTGTILDLNDANEVRKSFWDPLGFIEMPSPQNFVKVVPILKHLKGERRDLFFKRGLKAVYDINKDDSVLIPKPDFLKNSLGKKIFGLKPAGLEDIQVQTEVLRLQGVIDRKTEQEINGENIAGPLTGFFTFLYGEDGLRKHVGAIFGFFQSFYKAAKKELK